MINVWINSDNILTGKYIIGHGGNSVTTPGFSVYNSVSRIYSLASDSNKYSFSFSDELTTDTWYLITATFDRTGLIDQYINGSFHRGVSILNHGKVNPTYPLRIGQIATAFTKYFDGDIGETQFVRFTALPATIATDITTNYNRGLNRVHMKSTYTDGTVVAHYKWIPTNNTVLMNDESASDNNLTPTNISTDDSVVLTGGYK